MKEGTWTFDEVTERAFIFGTNGATTTDMSSEDDKLFRILPFDGDIVVTGDEESGGTNDDAIYTQRIDGESGDHVWRYRMFFSMSR